ncbi:uncharacterized mitochondrial protein AtMg00860-like [Cornus florida]|uniref:uncharacterized mitochondrial protein AtMg00860-like n=1 Tax=Cornus florida TaxID=4283 RepID=UPI00289BD2E9|nr:uncharacterized mitochondrial protein AtMg00860-like [Cornus florida]
MTPSELAELRRQLDELLESGYIQPSKAPVTVKNKYPVPNAADLFDRLSRASYFTKLDLRVGYWQEKCEFCRQEVLFLGYWISKGHVRMDKRKVKAILDWFVPTKVTELRSFLGLANYYRKFIKGYSKKVSPLTDLLKKDKQWVWSEECQKAFEMLKQALSTEPVLRLPDFGLPFEVHTDASNRAIGGVLV